MDGLPIRPTLAADLHVTPRTLDRMIAKAKALGLLDGVEIPRRPSPKQRDLLIACSLTEQWLDEHGPYKEPPPELLAELDRLRGEGSTKKRGQKR